METGCTARIVNRHQPDCDGPKTGCPGCKPCTQRGYHKGACADPDCTGCLLRLTKPGATICDKHHDDTAEALRALPQQWLDLEEWLPPGAGETTGQVYITGGNNPAEKTVANNAPLEHRDHIPRLLRSWIMAEFEAETGQLDLTMYASAPEIRLGNLTVKALTHWLTTRLDRITARDFAGDFATEITWASRRAHNLAHPTGRRVVGAGSCPEPECDGEVQGVMEPSQTLEYPALIICTANPDHAWKPDDFLAAGERIRRMAA